MIRAAHSDDAGRVCLWRGDEEATAFYISLGATMRDHFEGRILVGAADDTLAAEAEP